MMKFIMNASFIKQPLKTGEGLAQGQVSGSPDINPKRRKNM